MKHAFEKAMRQLGSEMGLAPAYIFWLGGDSEIAQIEALTEEQMLVEFVPEGADLTDPQADE